jgi:hypothetical protein
VGGAGEIKATDIAFIYLFVCFLRQSLCVCVYIYVRDAIDGMKAMS